MKTWHENRIQPIGNALVSRETAGLYRDEFP